MRNALIIFFLCTIVVIGETAHRQTIDLLQPTAKLNLIATRQTAFNIDFSITKGGIPYDASGDIGIFWFGPAEYEGETQPGVAFTNDSAGFGSMSWDLKANELGTNGIFRAQILVVDSEAGLEEWARGQFVIRDNPGVDYIPFDWDFNVYPYGEKEVMARDGRVRTAYLFPDGLWRVLMPHTSDGVATHWWDDTYDSEGEYIEVMDLIKDIEVVSTNTLISLNNITRVYRLDVTQDTTFNFNTNSVDFDGLLEFEMWFTRSSTNINFSMPEGDYISYFNSIVVETDPLIYYTRWRAFKINELNKIQGNLWYYE